MWNMINSKTFICMSVTLPKCFSSNLMQLAAFEDLVIKICRSVIEFPIQSARNMKSSSSLTSASAESMECTCYPIKKSSLKISLQFYLFDGKWWRFSSRGVFSFLSWSCYRTLPKRRKGFVKWKALSFN